MFQNRQQVDGNVGLFWGLDVNNVFVVGDDGNMWFEHGPFGTIPPQREQVDGNVLQCWPLNANDVYVEGTDGNLWLEHGVFSL
ncbi:MAG TPA: hypothetical protein VG099_09565 [Gemmataceae bacterium]|jgi:hypothetical protein|nr:hypothetical protein [Gemmataceae bacterium]